MNFIFLCINSLTRQHQHQPEPVRSSPLILLKSESPNSPPSHSHLLCLCNIAVLLRRARPSPPSRPPSRAAYQLRLLYRHRTTPRAFLFPTAARFLPSTMATRRALFRSSSLRSFATSSKPSHHNNHRVNHKFLEPNSFLGSWQAPKDPKEAEAKLAHLRREYAKQVKEVRKEYIREMELMALEKQRKDEARREALRVANEERQKLKAEAAKLRAQERQIAQQQFRQTLLKERAEKLVNWRMKVKMHDEKKKEKKELLRRQSSIWIDEADLERKILDAAAAHH